MPQPQNTTTASGETPDPVELPVDAPANELEGTSPPEEPALSPEEKAHWQLCEHLLAEEVALEVVPNRAMNWLIENTISPHPAYKMLLMINYVQWIILLPGVVALYFFHWLVGLAILAGCVLISLLVINPVKRWALRGGVKEFIMLDLDYLEKLYKLGAVRFRKITEGKKGKKKKGRWIQHPRDWREIL